MSWACLCGPLNAAGRKLDWLWQISWARSKIRSQVKTVRGKYHGKRSNTRSLKDGRSRPLSRHRSRSGLTHISPSCDHWSFWHLWYILALIPLWIIGEIVFVTTVGKGYWLRCSGFSPNVLLCHLRDISPGKSNQRMNDTGSRTSRIVRCEACGKSDACTPEDLLKFTKESWPKCCGSVMTYYQAVEPPEADDTKLDRPSL
jgi:hypothetical protein